MPLYSRDRRPTMSLFVRTAGEPEAIVPAVRNTIAVMDRSLAVYGVRTMAQQVAAATERSRLSAALLTGFAAVALTLALVGVYGVLAYTVSQRTREIGVRIALGAGGAQIVRGVVREGVTLALAGIAIGLACSWPATRYIRTLLYDVTPGDASVFCVSAGGLLIAAMAASWLPARRAARVQPVIALRGD
jgi:ABC-type antimicrobial peptide transport system permease subunit